MNVGTGNKASTNWPGQPGKPASQADQIVTNTTDPGRVYYVATDELGNFYVGEYFSVDQATGRATLNSSAFDLKGLESLQLGSLGGLIGASINEFSTDGTMSQNSDVKVPTQAAVKTYVDGKSAFTPTGGTFAITGALSVSTNAVITGNLTVNGTTTTVNSSNTTISDKRIELGTGTTGSATSDAGLIIERGSDNNVFIGFDESTNKFVAKYTAATGGTAGNDLTWTDDVTPSFGRLECSRLVTNEVLEKADVKTDVLTGTHNVNLSDNAVHYYTANASGNWTFNFRASASETLNAMMATGEVLTVTLLATNGGTAYIPSATNADCRCTIDGTATTVKWVGGTAPSGGNDNGIDAYTYSIIKTGSGAFTVIGSQTAYG